MANPGYHLLKAVMAYCLDIREDMKSFIFSRLTSVCYVMLCNRVPAANAPGCCDFHAYTFGFFYMPHGTNGFISLPKEGELRIFSP